jgi:hypothetical protein
LGTFSCIIFLALHFRRAHTVHKQTNDDCSGRKQNALIRFMKILERTLKVVQGGLQAHFCVNQTLSETNLILAVEAWDTRDTGAEHRYKGHGK